MPNNPVVASYVANFLKMDMMHIYWQLVGQRHDIDAHVFTHKRELDKYFPYHHKWMHVLPRPRLRSWRRFWNMQVLKRPWQIFDWELERWVMDLTRIDAQVLHIYFGHVAPQFIPLMKVWKHPVVVSYHGADAGVDMDKPGYRAAMQEVLRLATQIQCRSEALAADVIALGCDPAKVVIQRTGIPLVQWVFKERARPENGAWRLIQSCRFIEKKGLDLTLCAFAEVLKVYPQARLTLVGAGPLRAELEALAEQLKVTASVEFTGFLPLGGILKRTYESQIFLHPSRTGADGNREGVPNSMLEAMASGAVAVATDHGGIAEAITDGVSGLLVPENDAPALAAAVLRVMGDDALRLALAQGGRAAVEGKYSQELQSQHLIALYKDLILKAKR